VQILCRIVAYKLAETILNGIAVRVMEQTLLCITNRKKPKNYQKNLSALSYSCLCL